MDDSAVRFGEYQIIHEEGRGGKAIVYRALQPQLSRYVALKVLTRRDQASLLKFQQEGGITANFNHPGIRKVFTAGSTPDSTHYIVMEYVDLSLRQILQKVGGRPLRTSDAVSIVTQLAEVLDYIHGRGWVHLDIKPSNILRFNEGRVVLSDFGIARRIGQVEQHGTPQYMSPEQVLGQPVGPSSDVYSLGVVLYEMLAGRPPFQGENELAIMNQHRSEPPPPPKKFNRRLPSDVEKVVLKALAKDPRERYQSAGEMAKALQGTALRNNKRPQITISQIKPLPSIRLDGLRKMITSRLSTSGCGTKLMLITAIFLLLIVSGWLSQLIVARAFVDLTPAALNVLLAETGAWEMRLAYAILSRVFPPSLSHYTFLSALFFVAFSLYVVVPFCLVVAVKPAYDNRARDAVVLVCMLVFLLLLWKIVDVIRVSFSELQLDASGLSVYKIVFVLMPLAVIMKFAGGHGLQLLYPYQTSLTIELNDQGCAPLALAVDPDGEYLYVIWDRVFCAEKYYLATGEAERVGAAAVYTAIAVDNVGSLYVSTDEGHNVRKIQMLDTSTGDFKDIADYGSSGAFQERLGLSDRITGIAFDHRNNMYITTRDGEIWKRHALNGQWSCLVEKRDAQKTNQPSHFGGITIKREGADRYIYVVDPRNHCVQKLEIDGEYVRNFGKKVDSPDARPARKHGEFNRPVAIAVDGRGNVFVVDQNNHRLQMIEPDDKCRVVRGVRKLCLPNSIAIDGSGCIYITSCLTRDGRDCWQVNTIKARA